MFEGRVWDGERVLSNLSVISYLIFDWGERNVKFGEERGVMELLLKNKDGMEWRL